MTLNQAINQAIDMLKREACRLFDRNTILGSRSDGTDIWSSPREQADHDRIRAVVAELKRHVASDTEGMAACMDMVRQDLISMGIIGADVAPMFITEAVAGAIQRAVAVEREACAAIAEDEDVPSFKHAGHTYDIGYLLKRNIAAAIRKRGQA